MTCFDNGFIAKSELKNFMLSSSNLKYFAYIVIDNIFLITEINKIFLLLIKNFLRTSYRIFSIKTFYIIYHRNLMCLIRNKNKIIKC